MADQRTKIIIETDAGRSEQVLRNVQKGLQGVGNEAGKAGKNVQNGASLMDSSFAKTAISAAALGTAIKTAYSMAKDASNLSEARLYLQTFSADMGVSYQKLDEATRKATNGLVDNLTLIRMNHKALKLGVSTDVNDLARLWQISDAVGDEFGQSIEQTFEQITNAIATGNAKALISLGLLPESFKRATDKASLLEQRVSMLKTVFEQAGAGADSLGKHGTTVNDKFTQFDVAVKNLKTSLGEALIPVFIPVVEGLTAIADAASLVIDKFSQLTDLNSKSPLLGKSLEELKALRDSTASRATSLDFELEALSRPASQGGKAGEYTEGQRQQIAIQLAGEKQMLKEIDKVIGDLETKSKARAEAQKTVVAETKNETTEKVKTTAAQKAYNKEQDVAAKKLEELLALQVKSFGKSIEDGREAIQVLNSMTAAAGGFAIGLKDGTSEAGKLFEKLKDINNDIAGTLSGAGKNWQAELAKLSPSTAATGMMNFMSGGLFTAPGESAKDAIKDIAEPLSKTIAEAVQAGFANADFSDLSMTLGNILSSVISKSIAQSNPVMNAAGGIDFGNLGVNLAVNAATKVLTQPGRFFGGREEHGKEAIDQAASIKDQMGTAYVESFLSEIYSVYTPEYMKEQIRKGRAGYPGTSVGYSWDDSGDGIFSDKTRTYALVDNGASKALKTLTDAMDRVEDYNDNVESIYKLKSAEGYEYKVLTEQVDAYKKALDYYQYYGEANLFWSDGTTTEGEDLSEATREVKTALAELARDLGSATAERSTATASGFAKYAPWLSTIRQDRNGSSQSIMEMMDYFGPSPAEPGIVSTSGLSIGQQYDAFESLQTDFMDRNISSYLLDMVKQAGQGTFELQKLQIEDPEAYVGEYLEYIEKQMSVFEEVMERQEQIFNDVTKTFEERSASLANYEAAQESYYQAKLDALAAEQAAEEAIKQKQQEADLRKAERMEAALSLVGEVAQRGDKIVILQGGDSTTALKELLEKFSDDPEVSAILQAAIANNEAKARWGN